MDALLGEIHRTPLPFVPDTLYIGGGTPSSMALTGLAALFEALPYPFTEATLEAAPGTLTADALQYWKALGINRVSLGAQSFVAPELRRTGRRHTAETVAADIALLREEGIPDINVDLIAGLPGQTERSWGESLIWVERLAPPHVSVYMFEIDEDSNLGREVLLNGQRYGAPDLPSEDLTAALYETAVEHLSRIGLPRYEISNFARPGFESRHNLKYWELSPYIGFGADAHSFDGVNRWHNPDSIESYLAADVSPEPEPACANEKFWVGLRLSRGIVPTPEEWGLHHASITRLLQYNLLERSGPALRLTPRGVMLSNEVFEEFLPA